MEVIGGAGVRGKLESRKQKLEIGKQKERARNWAIAKLIKAKGLAKGSASVANSARIMWRVY